MSLKEALAAVIRGVRKSRGLSQEDFKTVDRTYLARIEAGRANPSLDVLQDIADALQIELELLFVLAVSFQTGAAPHLRCQELAGRCDELIEDGIFANIAEAANSSRASTGRREKGDPVQIAAEARKLRAQGLSLSEIARALGLSKTTIHRYLAD